jgi:hypothetical protein
VPKHYGGKVLPTLPTAWAAKGGHVITVVNAPSLASAVARYNGSGNIAGAAFYSAMKTGSTIAQWHATTALHWASTGQLKAGGTQSPTAFLQAATRNGWVKITAP